MKSLTILLLVVMPISMTTAAERRAKRRFSPSFVVTPLVQKFEASPGAAIDFTFDVDCGPEAKRIKIEPVGMLQQETGQVGPDETPGSVMDVIRIKSPLEMELKPGTPQVIRARLTVPNTDSSFQTYGLLISDMGPPQPGQRVEEEDPDSPVLGIKFATRYMVRIEVKVRGVKSESARKMEVGGGRLGDVDGRAVAEAFVTNPTGAQFEFEARCKLIQPNGVALGQPFKLAMPIRANPGDKMRYRSRILGNTKLKVHAPLPDPILPGDYQMVVELMVDGRVASTQTFPVAVTADQFPGQAAVVAQIVGDVRVSPSQLELSLRARGSRLLPVKVTNTSTRAVTVRLASAGSAGPEWLVVKPDVLTLGPGMSRNAMVTVRNAERYATHQYASLRLEVVPEDGGIGGGRDLPVALITRAPVIARLKAEAMEWDVGARPTGFTIPIRNEGSVHIPLQASVTFRDSFGRSRVVTAGFGRWLLPGESTNLRFPLEVPLEPGDYTIRGELLGGEGAEPILIEEQITISDTDAVATGSR